MRRADEAGFVRIVANEFEVDVDVLGAQEKRGASDGEFA